MIMITHRFFIPATWLCLFGMLIWLLPASTSLSAEIVRKPAKTILNAHQDPRRIAVKFSDGLYIRLRNNVLASTNAEVFAKSKSLFDTLSVGKWERADVISEDAMDAMRHRAEKNLGRALPDMNLQFYLTLPPGMDAATAIDRLNQLDIVELAQPVPLPQRAPLPPNYQALQKYMNASPVGGGVFQIWTNQGVFGTGIRVGTVDPGLAETEFSLVRFKGDSAKAKKVYEGTNPLTAQDIAETLVWVASRPAHVNIDELIIKPVDQAAIGKVFRRKI